MTTTFRSEEAIASAIRWRVAKHRRADEILQGATGQNGKGCAVWCTFDAYEHSRFPIELGIPEELGMLNDFIFESLPVKDSKKWPERFLKAAAPGSNLSLVWDRFTHWILTEEHPDRGKHCARMGALFARRISGTEPPREEWDRAARAARDAWDASARRMADKLIELMEACPGSESAWLQPTCARST